MTTAVATPDPDDGDDELARKREELLARRTKVMFLRNAGATWATIAAECGVSEATARKDYAVVCRDINAEQPANVVARHRAVIFDIQRANYPAMMTGDKDAAATILKALDREAKLLGLDAPTKVLAAVSNEDFAVEAARLIARINALDPTTLKELERVQRRHDPEVIDGTIDHPIGSLDNPADPGVDDEDGQPDTADPGQPVPGVSGQPGHAGPVSLDGWSNIEDD